jgi:hypothetical protein
MATTRKQFYHFSYYIPPKVDKFPQPHQLRDGDALLEVSNLLYRAKYRFGGIIFNPPAPEPTSRSKSIEIRKVDTDFLQPEDLIVLTTRPPLNDSKSDARKIIRRSYTSLEEQVFDKLKTRVFRFCSRSYVELTERLCSKLPRKYSTRGAIFFTEGRASYKAYRNAFGGRFRKPEEEEESTAFYLISLPKESKDDISLLCLFGMSGANTLTWCHLVPDRIPSKVSFTSPRFIMAEMTIPEYPKLLHTFSFAKSFKPRIILDTAL